VAATARQAALSSAALARAGAGATDAGAAAGTTAGAIAGAEFSNAALPVIAAVLATGTRNNVVANEGRPCRRSTASSDAASTSTTGQPPVRGSVSCMTACTPTMRRMRVSSTPPLAANAGAATVVSRRNSSRSASALA
jgi:hypothetical protein